ncbi:hypothetical protein [uncultured Lutibacter sp.]|uniref:hypothetical protein n=1 Tax=uncultured Lutibacter sp. TaxID=437739 RepID=UPI002631AA21|nr:hypothetical protein [uncultured Lutibacter sp.]
MRDIALKSLIILPVIAFVDYILMIVVGCTSCLFGLSNSFYQCTFCTIGKIVLISSILGFIIYLFSDIWRLYTSKLQNS